LVADFARKKNRGTVRVPEGEGEKKKGDVFCVTGGEKRDRDRTCPFMGKKSTVGKKGGSSIFCKKRGDHPTRRFFAGVPLRRKEKILAQSSKGQARRKGKNWSFHDPWGEKEGEAGRWEKTAGYAFERGKGGKIRLWKEKKKKTRKARYLCVGGGWSKCGGEKGKRVALG